MVTVSMWRTTPQQHLCTTGQPLQVHTHVIPNWCTFGPTGGWPWLRIVSTSNRIAHHYYKISSFSAFISKSVSYSTFQKLLVLYYHHTSQPLQNFPIRPIQFAALHIYFWSRTVPWCHGDGQEISNLASKLFQSLCIPLVFITGPVPCVLIHCWNRKRPNMSCRCNNV